MRLADATILVVDDEPVLREIFGKWLTTLGCAKVSLAGDGEEALALLQTDHFDLLVTDVRMPKVDGVTLVRRLWELGQSIPSIIFVSGFGDVDKREMYGLGVEAFLSKPLRMEELVALAEKALAERGELWLMPMQPEPRQAMVADVEVDSETVAAGNFYLGRGGFSVRYSGLMSTGKVAFRCAFQLREREMTGQGYVRWHSSAEQAVGVEFVYLAESCRLWVLDEIAGERPRSYIPPARH